jgi:hypothetical protein
MKQNLKLFVVAFMLLFSCTLSNAQLSIGPKAGINISNISGASFDDVKKKALVGFHLGGYVAIRLGGLVVQPELLYSTQGAKVEESTTTENLKINYFNVPVMVKYVTSSGLYLETGPQLGFLTSAKFGNEDIKETVKSSDFSWGAGLGYQKKAIGLGVRYNVGISKLGDASTVDPADVDYKNGVFQVSLFVALFGAPKK